MTEPINEPTDNVAELATLRKLRDELLSTKHMQKARITELESEVLQLTEARDNALATARAVTIDLPLRKLSEEMSAAPALWLREFMADYNVDANNDGTLILKTKSGEPITLENGKPIQLTASDVRKFLLSPNKAVTPERRRDFSAITIASKASGTVGAPVKPFTNSGEDSGKPLAPHFGLR